MTTYDKPTILRRAAHVIAGARHADYDRTVDYARKCTAFVDPEDEAMDEFLQQFAPRETDKQFEQRKRLTKHTTKSSISKATSPYDKVPRAKYRKVAEFAPEDEGRQKELDAILTNFAGEGVNVEAYLAERLKALNETDPNTFIVGEFAPFGLKQRAQTYPFEVPSIAAVDYVYQKGVLQYLIAKQQISIDEIDPAAQKVARYTVYLKDQTVVLQEMTKEETTNTFRPGLLVLPSTRDKEYSIELSDAYTPEPYFLRIGSTDYRVTEALPHGAGYVPAKKAGFKPGKGAMSSMMVSLFDPAMPHLEEAVGTKSQLDLVQALSAFPFVIRIEEECPGRDCHKGYLANGDVCGVCHGSGRRPRPMSAQEELTITLPHNSELKDLPDLRNTYVFVAPPVPFLEYMDKRQANLDNQVIRTLYNSDIFTREEIQATATGKNIDLDSVNDVIWPFADHFSEMFTFLTQLAAKFADLDADLVVSMRFDKDLRLKTQLDLLNELESANRAEAGPAFRQRLQRQLMERVTADDPTEFQRYTVRESFDPFSGYTEAERLFALNSSDVTKETKILALNLGNIFDTLELQAAQSGKDFYALKRTEQLKAIQAEVARIIADIRETNPGPRLSLAPMQVNGNGVEKEEAA